MSPYSVSPTKSSFSSLEKTGGFARYGTSKGINRRFYKFVISKNNAK
jgi:hypothetical protein